MGRKSLGKAKATERSGAGRPLCLADQYTYTAGGCATFARAAQPILGGTIALLHAKDPRQLREHDHPLDVAMYVHVFVLTDAGQAIDAEGIRPVREMARAFGVKRGYDYAVVTDAGILAEEFPTVDAGRIETVTGIIRDHGWEAGVPEADGRLVENWAQAIREEAIRDGRAKQPTERQARLFNLTPYYEALAWSRFARLVIRSDETRGYVVWAADGNGMDEQMVTSAETREQAVEVAGELEAVSGLDFDSERYVPGMR